MKSIMIYILSAVIYLGISGCAARAVHETPGELGFIKISQGTGQGLYSIFSGSARYCMVEFFNQTGITIDAVIYEDGVCNVHYHTDDKLL